MVGLVDCNNFFVSCERVFNPKLEKRPVVVLSGNDGCVIARSNEAKALGIAMGEPFFRVKHLHTEGTLDVCSSNIRLYGDMSKRVMGIVGQLVPHIEVYSIDEAFMNLEDVREPAVFCRNLVEIISKWVGIPVSIGVAETKTLAKVASKFAKRYPGYKGCCIIDNEKQRTKALQLFPIGDVWGIGRKNCKALNLRGVSTAYDFTQWDERRVSDMFGISGVRTWRELQGKPCISFEKPSTEKTVTHSQSFRNAITDFNELSPLVADFAAAVTARIRRHGCYGGGIEVYIRTDRFDKSHTFYANTACRRFEVPTNDPREVIKMADCCLKEVYRPSLAYKKAGVTLYDISRGRMEQGFFDNVDRKKQERLLRALDAIKNTKGQGAIRVAAQGSGNDVRYKNFCSPCYTTCVEDIIKVRID